MFLRQGSQYNVNKYTNTKNKLQGLNDNQLVKGQKANEREGKTQLSQALGTRARRQNKRGRERWKMK